MKTGFFTALLVAGLTSSIAPTSSGQLFGPSTFNHDLDADGVPETITVSGTTAQIVSRAYGNRKFTIPARSSWQISELDGRRGDEILFSNLMLFQGVPQPAMATVVANKRAKTYSVGKANYVQLHELDGQPGMEAVFTNLLLFQGVPQPARALVVNSRTQKLQTYSVGRMGQLEFANLDGQPGDEMIFNSWRTINTIPQPAQATIVDMRAGIVKTFNVGRTHGHAFVERNGKPGLEAVFYSSAGSIVISFDAASGTFVAR